MSAVTPFVPKHIAFQTSEAKKEKGIHCCAYCCTNKPDPRKRGLCHKHYHTYRRMLDPVYDRFVNFRGNAMRRSKEFTITLEEFREWCQQTGYILQKGKRGKACTVDRVNNQYGYHIWNIQLMTNKSNIRKYHHHDKQYAELAKEDPDYVPF